MSIVKMKRLRLLALNEEKETLLSLLLRAGCVEVRETSAEEEGGGALLRPTASDAAVVQGKQTEIRQALDALSRYKIEQVEEIAKNPFSQSYKEIGGYIARIEHFSVGVNQQI
jgi:vacuolar-type H+-ATPase subunit I/STV1